MGSERAREVRTAAAIAQVSSDLAESIQRNMPWPFSDVGRNDSEGAATALAITIEAMKVVRREFRDLSKQR